MAQAGFTPISLYFSTTAAAVPTSANLVAGELALNTVDEKLYFKNSAGTVKLLASNATSAPVLTFSAGTTGFTPNTATSGAVTLAGTLATTNGGTGLTSFTSGGVVYASSSSALATGSALYFSGANLGVGNASPQALLHVGSVVEAPGFGTTSQMSYVNGTSQPEVLVRQTTNDVVVSMYADSTGGSIRTATNHPLSFITNNTEKMRLDTSGNLGIGTSSPAYKLDVLVASNKNVVAFTPTSSSGISDFSTGGVGWRFSRPDGGALVNSVYSYDTAAAAKNNFVIQARSDLVFTNGGDFSGATERMRLDSSGNVGIGTSSPSSTLDVVGTLTSTGTTSSAFFSSGNDVQGGNYPTFTFKVANSNTGFLKWRNAAGTDHWAIYSSMGASGQQGNLAFRDLLGGENRVDITPSGSVGIGTPSPAAKLEVVTGTGVNVSTATFRTGDATAANNGGGGFTATSSATAGNRNARMWLDADGANFSGSDYFYIDKVGNDGIVHLVQQSPAAMTFSTNGTERARIDSSGNLLMGKTSTDLTSAGIFFEKLNYGRFNFIKSTASGTGATPACEFYYNGSGVGNITNSSTATAYNTSSDYRLKNTIAPMTGALAKVALLKPCTYKWNVDGANSQGFIAHELAEVCPEAVVGEKDAVDAKGNPKYQGVDTSFLVATLTAAIQEQQAIIESLKARLDAANL